MKKLAVLIVCAAVMASCDSFSGGSKNQLKAENDSLLMELTQRNAELDEMMGTFNDISEGFRQINAAESRVDLQRGAVAEGSLNAKQQIASDIEFIRKQMEENKDQKILTNTGLFKKGQVLKDSDINKDYFTQVDIRTTKEIKLYSKDADILTTHPAGSYALEKDDKGQLTLKITNPKDFWSVSKYLGIQVK